MGERRRLLLEERSRGVVRALKYGKRDGLGVRAKKPRRGGVCPDSASARVPVGPEVGDDPDRWGPPGGGHNRGEGRRTGPSAGMGRACRKGRERGRNWAMGKKKKKEGGGFGLG